MAAGVRFGTPLVALLGVALLGGMILSAVAQGEWRKASPAYEWSFPRDHWAKRDFKTEWWYFTGHLQDVEDPARRFGYQFTLFRIGISPDASPLDSDWGGGHLLMGHAAVTDLSAGLHRFSEILYRESPLLAQFSSYPEPRIAWSLGPPGTETKWSLDWTGRGFAFAASDAGKQLSFSLSTEMQKPLVFQGPLGLSPKSADGESASHYYSFTRMKTEGSLALGGRSYRVDGVSWMDKEFSTSFLSEEQKGWDWFSLQFDDETEWMLFQLRRASGEVDFRWATEIDRTGQPRYFTGDEWELEVEEHWSSPSGARYPVQWSLKLPTGVGIRIASELEDQENRSRLIPGLAYWEGAVSFEDALGNRAGRGYVEMTGYGPETSLPGLSAAPSEASPLP